MKRLKCDCASRGRPLWSVRYRDRYCPECGAQLRRLLPVETCSLGRYPQRMHELWLYPQDESPGKFAFPVSLCYSGPQRTELWKDSGVPVKEPLEITLLTGDNSQVVTQVIEEDGRRTAIGIHLHRQANNRVLAGGRLEAILKVQGDFPAEEWQLNLCNHPQLDCELRGEGVRRSRQLRGLDSLGERLSHWEITESTRLRLTLKLTVRHAPLVVGEKGLMLTVEFYDREGDVDGTCLHSLNLRPDSQLQPGTVLEVNFAWQSTVQVDTHDMQLGHVAMIRLELNAIGEPSPEVTHTLKCLRVESAGITVEPKQVSLPVMYVGEHRSNDPHDPLRNPEGCAGAEWLNRWGLEPVLPFIEVRNGGRESVLLEAPLVKGTPGMISARFGVQETSEDGPSALMDGGIRVRLPPGKSCWLIVEIQCHDADAGDDQKQAQIILENDQRAEVAKLLISIDRIEQRRDSTTPLFLDFGSENTYACVSVQQRSGFVRRPAHDLRTDEQFPSTLFFVEMVSVDLARSKCLIGPLAVERDLLVQGPDRRSRLIQGLKYRFGGHYAGEEQERVLCQDEVEGTAWLSLPELMAMILGEIVRSAELILRGVNLRHLVISYPARWTPHQRRQYLSAMQSACTVVSSQRPGAEIQLENETLIDEANAAVLGFVYDAGDFYRRRITECLERNDQSLTVAAVDLGGGSLDIALIHFQNVGESNRRPRYKSEYLWIGGDSQLGGNNLTAATLEWLRCHWSDSLIGMANAFDEVPFPDEHFAGRTANRASRFQALWRVAESLKIGTCTQKTWNERDIQNFHGDLQVAARRELSLPTLDRVPWPNLDDLLNWPIARDQHGVQGYTFSGRVRKQLEALSHQIMRRKAKLDFVVLGGSASKTPGIREELETLFGTESIVWDPKRLKSRVAEGLAAAWNVLGHSQEARPACAGDYTTTPLALWDDHHQIACPFLDICTPIKSNDPFPLRLIEEPLLSAVDVLQDLMRWTPEQPDRWQLRVVRLVESDQYETAGLFDSASGWFVATGYQNSAPSQNHWKNVTLRFHGAEDRLILMIESAVGTWETTMVPA